MSELDLIVKYGSYLAWANFAASGLRIGWHYLEQPLAIWHPRTPESRWWAFYDKVDSTLAWLAGALSKFGRKDLREQIAHTVEQTRTTAEIPKAL